jgi:GDPmannose 4,6-dehydratase
MWLMPQQDEADDYVICSTCLSTSVTLRSIIECVFSALNIPPERLIINPNYYQPTDIVDIYGNNTKSKNQLGWTYDRNFFDVVQKIIEDEARCFRT